jgi:hypothetical protein
MTAIVMKNFKGMLPFISPSLLPSGYAQEAENCDLGSGRLKPFIQLMEKISWHKATYGDIRTIYRYGDIFLFWLDDDISVVKGEVPSSYNRLFYTGDGYPKQTDTQLMAATGRPSDTSEYRRLGVTTPAAALTIHGPSGTGDGTVIKTVSYYYTYVCKWSDGTEEESAPSPETAIVDVEGGEYISLSNFVVPTLVATGNDVTHLRLYRLEVGNIGAEYELLESRPGGATASGVYDIPVASITDTATQVYDTDGVPSGLNDNVDEPCPTEGWSPAPTDLSNIGNFINGMLGGFSGKKFVVSEPLYWYAWNPMRKVTLNSTPVAWGTCQNVAIVATDSFPYIITGADPESLSGEPLVYPQACLSSRGFIITPYGAIYPSPDGLCLIDPGSDTAPLKVITSRILSKKQWNALPPSGSTHADLVSFFYDGVYYGFWAGTSKGFIFDFLHEPFIRTIGIGDDYTIYHGCIDPDDDAMYLLEYDETYYTLAEWEGHPSNVMTLTYKSRKVHSEPINFGYGIVLGDHSTSAPATVTIYGDGVELASLSIEIIVRTGDGLPVVTGDGEYVTLLSEGIIDEAIFTMPKGAEYSVHEIKIETQAEIDGVIIATSPEEIMQEVKAFNG